MMRRAAKRLALAMQLLSRSLLVGVAVLALSAGTASAEIITTTPHLPPTAGADGGPAVYQSAAQVHATYTGAALTAVLSNVKHGGFSNISVSFSGGNELETFNSVLTGTVSVNGSPDTPFTLTGPVGVTVFGRTSDSELGTFNTQMTQLGLSGSVMGNPVEIRIDPTVPTTGQTSIADAGGGLFRIDSFFDVFTDISLDSGATWTPATNPIHVSVTDPLPEPSTLTLFGIGGAAGVAGTVWKRRRARRAA